MLFSHLSIFVPGNDQIQLSLESIHLLFFILRYQICKIPRKCCIFDKILYIWQGTWDGANMHNFQQILHICICGLRKCGIWLSISESPCANMHNFLNILHICTVPHPLPNTASMQNYLEILHIWHLKIKKVNGCSPNSAGCPVLAELTISAAEH